MNNRKTEKTVVKVKTPEIKIVTPNLVRVMNKITKEVIIIDANKEKDYKTKYLHCWGSAFID